MRPLWKLFLFLAASLFFLCVGAVLSVLMIVTPKFHQRITSRLVELWARTMLRILEITVSVAGPGTMRGTGMMIVSNHQSYLDIIVLASKTATLFVAKKDVRSWPLLGWLAAIGGTLFIDRTAFRGAIDAMEGITLALQNNVNVLFFPEGTSTNGGHIAPFKPSLFRSAVKAECPVLPVTLNYCTVAGSPVNRSNRDLICWYGAMTFSDHFWSLLNIRTIHASITVHNTLQSSAHHDPKLLSESAFTVIANGFTPIE